MTIQEFNQALQEQGSEIQQAYGGKLKQKEIRLNMEPGPAPSPSGGGWGVWT